MNLRNWEYLLFLLLRYLHHSYTITKSLMTSHEKYKRKRKKYTHDGETKCARF